MLLRHHKHPLYRRSYKAAATDYLEAQLLVQPQHQQINYMYTENGTRLRIDKLLAENGPIWGKSLSNELGRLTQGVRDIVGNDAMDFIPCHEVPKTKRWHTPTWYVTINLTKSKNTAFD